MTKQTGALTIGVSVAVAYLYALVVKLAKFAWEDVWAELMEVASKIEAEMSGAPGIAKRDAALAAAFAWLSAQTKIKGFEKFIIQRAIIFMTNGLIEALNNGLGHDWLAKAQALHEHIEDLIPWLDDNDDSPVAVPSLG